MMGSSSQWCGQDLMNKVSAESLFGASGHVPDSRSSTVQGTTLVSRTFEEQEDLLDLQDSLILNCRIYNQLSHLERILHVMLREKLAKELEENGHSKPGGQLSSWIPPDSTDPNRFGDSAGVSQWQAVSQGCRSARFGPKAQKRKWKAVFVFEVGDSRRLSVRHPEPCCK